MKILKPAFSLLLWISACFATVSAPAQTELIPPLPVDNARPAATNNQPLAQPTPSPTPGPIYIDILNNTLKLEKGDRLSYRVAEDRTPAVPIMVSDAGEIDVPLIGHMKAMGKTCKQLANEIKPLLESQYYYKATVIIGLETHSERSIGKVYIMGQIRMPGGLEIPASETLTVSKTIARAQGFADYADRENVRLIRRNEQGEKEMTIINVAEIIDKGLLEKDPVVLPNDTLIIPEVKRFHSKVYVLGRVNQPSGLDLGENEQITVSKAVARAQGFAEYADKEKVKLLRKNVVIPWFVVEELLDPVALSKKVVTSPDPLSRYLKGLFAPASLDVLSNPASTKQQQKFVLIEEFNKAIQGALLYDDQRFLDISLSADAKRLKAQNPKGDDLIRLNRILLEDAYVRELKKNRPPEYQTFIVNVSEIIDRGMIDKDPILQPNDLIIVPESKRTNAKVSIMGQVHYPQTMDMLPGGNLTVSQVIAHAGGFSDFANKSKVKLLRRNPAESYLFVSDDIVKLRALVKRLREHRARDPLCLFLWEHFNNPARQVLMDPRATPAQQQLAIIGELNRFMKAGSLYTESRFTGIKIPSEISLAITAQSGNCLLTPTEFLDISGFVSKLTNHTDPFFQFLWDQFSEPERKALQDAAAATRLQEAILMEVLLTKLNAILRGGSIYHPGIFEKIELSPESLALLTHNPQGEELVHLNRLLLEDACPQEIKKSPFNPQDKSIIRLNRRLLEIAFEREIKRHDEFQTIMVNMERIIDKAELDKDPLIEPDDLIMVPERWINF